MIKEKLTSAFHAVENIKITKDKNAGHYLRNVFRILKFFWIFHLIVYRKFFSDKVVTLAQSLAFTTILSIVPLFIIFFFVIGNITSQASVQGELYQFISGFLVPDFVSDVFSKLEELSGNAYKFGVIGFPTLMLVGVLMYLKIDDCINVIWKTGIRRKLHQNMMAFFISIFVGPVLLVILLSMPTYLQSLPYLMDVLAEPFVVTVLSNLVPFGIMVLVFLFIFVYVPVTHVDWKSALLGAIVTSSLVSLSNSLLGIYLSNFSNYNMIYGSLSILPIFLMWIYTLWLLVLIGVIFSYVAQNFSSVTLNEKDLEVTDQSLLNKVLMIFLILTESFHKLDGAPSIENLEDELGIPTEHLKDILRKLLETNLITAFQSRNRKGVIETRYQLGMAPSKISLDQLREGFHKTLNGKFENPDIRHFVELVQAHPLFNKKISIQEIYENPNKALSEDPRVLLNSGLRPKSIFDLTKI